MLCTDIRRWFYVGKNDLSLHDTVKQMSRESINAGIRKDVDSKSPSIRRKYKNELLLYFRPPSVMTRIIGKITMNSTFSVEKLVLTNKNQSYPPTGTRPYPRYVSE